MKKVITVIRQQECHILVDVPDGWTDSKIHRDVDPDELCKQAGHPLDWEEVEDRIIADVRDPTEEAVAECSGEATVR